MKIEKNPLQAGMQFGRLTTICQVEKKAYGKIKWLCRCNCPKSTEKVFLKDNLIHGKSRSCGCIRKEELSKKSRIHGSSGTPLYNIWCGMKSRCTNQNEACFKDYGGRGITVCSQWMNDFQAFRDYIGPRPSPAHSLDRINVNGNYEPGNVQWATKCEQSNNTRRTCLLTLNGKTLSASQWAEETGIPSRTILLRIDAGWTVQRALIEPIRALSSTRSCSFQAKRIGNRTTHGMSHTSEHDVWERIKGKCHNPNNKAFKNYGARGITMCAEWMNDFPAFLNYVGPKPSSEHSLDRIDNEKGYEPGNVRWATAKEQANNRRNSQTFTLNGKTQPASLWEAETGIRAHTILYRRRKGWTDTRALTQPPQY